MVVGGVAIGKINVLVKNRRVEYAFTPEGGTRITPRPRYFPDNASTGSWFRSNEIDFTIAAPTIAQMQTAILGVLFDDEPATASGNDWGCPFTRTDGANCNSDGFYRTKGFNVWAGDFAYAGGHSGWDAQATAASGPFYSLTSGIVVAAGIGNCKDIAVYDPVARMTAIYLHAGSSAVEEGQLIGVGDLLGKQGTACTGSAHVHLEVREGQAPVERGASLRIYARGAGLGGRYASLSCNNASVDPLPYLYYATFGIGSPPTHSCPSSAIPGNGISDGDRINLRGDADQYVVWTDGTTKQRFKRLLLNEVALNAHLGVYPQSTRHIVTDQVFKSFPTSALAHMRDARGNLSSTAYLLCPTGDDTGRKIPIRLSASVFQQAGGADAAIFPMTFGESKVWSETGSPITAKPIRCPE